MQQVSREKALKRFREGKVKVLVATDVAARGIDVTDVTHVINYTCPEDEKTYVHRIGRTGRAGASGVAVTFVDWADVTRWKVINKALDLPFDEPTETYSTSEHFFHDMGIPPDATGRLVPPSEVKVERKDSRQGGRGGQGDRGDRPASNDRQDRPRRNRSRNRTRAASRSTVRRRPNQGAAKAQSGEGQQGNRSRNRRRRSRGAASPRARLGRVGRSAGQQEVRHDPHVAPARNGEDAPAGRERHRRMSPRDSSRSPRCSHRRPGPPCRRRATGRA